MADRKRMLRLIPPRRSSAGANRHRSAAVAAAVAAAVLAAALAAPVLGAGTATADPIADKKAEAARIAAEIQANGDHISQLDEQYNAATVQLADLKQRIAEEQDRVRAAERELAAVSDELAGRAASLYVGRGNASLFPELDASSVTEAASLAHYHDAAAAHDNRLIARYRVARETANARRADLERQQAEARARQDQLSRSRSDLEALNARQKVLLAKTQGELADLVKAEQLRRQREAEAAARAAMERRAAQERAARDRARNNHGGGGGTALPAPNARTQIALDTAMAQLGKPYLFAAAGPDRFDCSGLMVYAWNAAGVSVIHFAEAIYYQFPHVPMDSLSPGDMVFYGNPIHHVGMYIGNGQYVNAPQTGDVVKVASIYRPDYAGAVRVP